jgi:DNA-binding response OmpR family regulator
MEIASARAVLLVEPDPIVGSLVGGFVFAGGLNAVHATDPVSAVRLHRQIGEVAIAIIEVNLPGPWNVVQLIDALRQNQPSVPVLMISASFAGEEEAVMSDIPFLRRPFGRDELLALLPTIERQLAA